MSGLSALHSRAFSCRIGVPAMSRPAPGIIRRTRCLAADKVEMFPGTDGRLAALRETVVRLKCGATDHGSMFESPAYIEATAPDVCAGPSSSRKACGSGKVVWCAPEGRYDRCENAS